MILIVASWLFSPGEKPSGPRIIRKLSGSTRERTQSEEKEQAEDSSHPKGIEVLLRETARKSYPDNVDNPMIAPQDDEVRQCGRVLELQNRDLWTRPADLSWHFPILATIRELPFQNYRGRSLANLDARDEAKKNKTLKKVARIGTQPHGGSHLGPGLLHLHFLSGENGAQKKRVSVLIGSQLIGTAQIVKGASAAIGPCSS